ncbi:MFS transporter [Rubrivivax sp. A210]|uniref:MFS transporter n=1 Tax=Rubrivivax sp. A210 TaxID=2772301 RepID=UPI0019C2368F|nr:MFS transporter [Rubrivivax sp. A210]CAD5371857.1 MFS transporter [Rubrivivax sp. A210]
MTAAAAPTMPSPLATAAIFGAFAYAYFLSALLRAVTATLAPVFSGELGLQAADLGLLAGAYFFGFAALQLPLGRALDRFGPRRTLLTLMTLAVAGCGAFALASGLAGLIAARALIGAGVAACLMAPLTCYRRLYSAPAQLRANSWMLMTGSLGMLASTLPVQWLLGPLGWRGLFWLLAALLALAMALVWIVVPRDAPPVAAQASDGGYREVLRHPLFRRLAPLAFFVYGGLIAVQSLWAGPWLTRVSGWTAAQAAQGLFAINLAMLLAFFCWGAAMPALARLGIPMSRLIGRGLWPALLLLPVIIVLGERAGAAHWALWCVACTFVSTSQPAVGVAFAPALAGRALSAYNLVIFAGVFGIQWGIGLLIDALRGAGLTEIQSFRIAFGVFWLCGAASFAWFLRGGGQGADNQA